jgi:Sulfatase
VNSPETGNKRGSTLLYVAAAALLASTLFVTLPGSLFLANLGEFTIATSDLFLFTIPMLLGGLTLAVIVYFLIPAKARPVFVAVVFGLAFLVWLQGNVLVWDYGPLDGRSIAWEEHRGKGLIDTAIWIAVIVLAVALVPRMSFKAALVFPMVILTASVVQLGVAILGQPADANVPSVKKFRIDDTSKFEFSRENNVVLIVVDEFQSDVFSEVTTQPEYREAFDGFTYFPDAVAGSNFTQLAIPALLTGTLYDNTGPRSNFMEETFLKYSITTLLKQAGFDVGIYPWIGWGNETFFFHEDVASNLESRTSSDSQEKTYSEKNAKEVLQLIDLTLFRSAPHFLKHYIYNDQKWFALPLALSLVPDSMKQAVSTDNQYETNVFVREALQRTSASDLPATFRYYHVKGAHRPLSVTPDLQFTNEVIEFNRDNYVASIKANIRELNAFLDRLKADGLFDRSLLVIVGDHGSGNTPDVYIRPNNDAIQDDKDSHTFQKQKARGVPIVLIKRVGASGPMQQNDAPVSLMDIPATIIAETGIDAAATGRSVFEIGPDELRARS